MPKDEKRAIASYLSRVVSTDQSPAPKNRVEARIGGETFTIVAPESEEYIRRVAAYVDAKITAITDASHLTLADAAVLAACNITDEQFKSAETAENLRSQLKSYLDDIARLRVENSELRKEIAKAAKTEKE